MVSPLFIWRIFLLNIKKSISWLLVLLWMGIIFFFSAQSGPESGALSSNLTEQIIALLKQFNLDISVQVSSFESILRTNAHFIAYFILGILVFNALRWDDASPYHQSFIRAFIISVLYAISDEFHQYFVPERAAELKDVLVDSAGALSGILIIFLILRIRAKVSKRQSQTTKSSA